MNMDIIDDIEPSQIIALFTEDIQGDSIHERLFTAGNMYLIAAALGPESTRNSLLPFLMSGISLDGEVKAIIAEQLGGFVKYVGGSKFATCLLEPLKLLADSDEIFVREKAVKSLANVCNHIPSNEADPVITKFLISLFSSPQITFKTDACMLLPQLYERLADSNKAKLRRAFVAMLKDETPSVRRAALASLPDLINVLKQTTIMSEIVRQGLQERLNDDDESIRVMIPGSLPAIAAKISPQDRVQFIVPISRVMVKDSSWWVRANMAKALPKLIPYFGQEFINSDIGMILLILLRDPDPEVKTAACQCCRQVIDVLQKVPNYFIDTVLPEVNLLAAERFKQVREEVAADILYFAKIVPDNIAEEKIFPLVAQLINDTERDVVIAVLRSLSNTFGAINSFSITRVILPKLIEVATKEDWRVRIEIIRNFCIFLPFVTGEAIHAQIIPLIGDWLQDEVYAVREEMAMTLPDFLQVMQGDTTNSFNEVIDAVISVIMRLNHSQKIPVRQAALLAASYIGQVLPQDVITERILPPVILMASDKVVNVRILAAKTLNKLKSFVNQSGLQKIKLCMKQLASDPDNDVRYFVNLY